MDTPGYVPSHVLDFIDFPCAGRGEPQWGPAPTFLGCFSSCQFTETDSVFQVGLFVAVPLEFCSSCLLVIQIRRRPSS